MRKVIALLTCLVLLVVSAFAGGGKGSPGSSHPRPTHSSASRSGGSHKTGSVRTYQRKNGTVVYAHKRSAPGSATRATHPVAATYSHRATATTGSAANRSIGAHRSATTGPSNSRRAITGWSPAAHHASMARRATVQPSSANRSSAFRCVGCARDGAGRIQRSEAAKTTFERIHPCPSTGRTSGACPGYQVDHRQPLYKGGSDTPANMQWLSTVEHKAKHQVLK
jgi:hypothetical protein